MATPKLHTSTEFVVVRTGGSHVDQAVARTLCGQELGATGTQNGLAPRAVAAPGTTTATSATAAILRPAVQHRPEWAQDLASAPPFIVPSTFIQSSDAAPVSASHHDVRYVADRHDLAWISAWAAKHSPESLPVCADGGKCAAHLPDAEWDKARAHLCVLELCFTALEISWYESRPAAPDAIKLCLPSGTLPRQGSTEALEAIRVYWVAKRRAFGATRPLIPALHVPVLHEYNAIGPEPGLLGDCPLPFKQREWSAPVIRRKAHATGGKASVKADEEAASPPDSHSPPSSARPELLGAVELVERATRLSEAVRLRESLRHRHTQLALYELALLRQGEKIQQTSESSWQRLRLGLKRGHATGS